MSIYKIEASNEYPGAIFFKTGELLPADIYTESLPSRLPIYRFPSRVTKFVAGRVDSGGLVSGLIEFQQQGLLFFNTEPDLAIERIEELKAILLDLRVDANARDNILGNTENVEIPLEHMMLRGGLKLLVPYRSPQPLTARLKLS